MTLPKSIGGGLPARRGKAASPNPGQIGAGFHGERLLTAFSSLGQICGGLLKSFSSPGNIALCGYPPN